MRHWVAEYQFPRHAALLTKFMQGHVIASYLAEEAQVAVSIAKVEKGESKQV